MKTICKKIGLFSALALFSWPAMAEIEAEVESGAVVTTRNDVRVPGDGGSSFSLVSDLSSSSSPFFRLSLGARIADRHLVSVLYAPLQTTASGTLDRDIEFLGASYPANTPLLAIYRFNSYRLTYRYSIVKNETWEVGLGLAAKIRDAEIALYGAFERKKTNTGFVPLINVHINWNPTRGILGFVLNADALAAPQGRAEDVLVALTFALRRDIELRLGYRTLEGGVNNEEVFNFAWLNYGVVGLKISM